MARGRRPKLTDRTAVEVTLPTELVAKMQLELYSHALGTVPHGAVAELFTTLLSEWLSKRGVKA